MCSSSWRHHVWLEAASSRLQELFLPVDHHQRYITTSTTISIHHQLRVPIKRYMPERLAKKSKHEICLTWRSWMSKIFFSCQTKHINITQKLRLGNNWRTSERWLNRKKLLTLLICCVFFVNEEHIIDFIQIAETFMGSQTAQNIAIVRWDEFRSLKTEWCHFNCK